MTFVDQILTQMSGVAKPQRRFMLAFLGAMTAFVGKANMTNLHRLEAPCPRTQARWHKVDFNWIDFNIRICINQNVLDADAALVIDACFNQKSGTETWGVSNFYDSCQNRAHRGLEFSLIAIVRRNTSNAWALDARQTPAQFEHKDIENRTLHYSEHLRNVCQDERLKVIKYVLADGLYANFAFVNTVLELNKHIVSRLRKDANLRYIYNGPQKQRGRKRIYAGHVDLNNLSAWDVVDLKDAPGLEARSLVVNHPHLQQNILVLIVWPKGHPTKRKLYFTTDLNMNVQELWEWYKARFQIEFLFRDGKQYAGLSDGQMRSQKGLNFHFNASMSTVNILRHEAHQRQGPGERSILSLKRCKYNQLFLRRVFFQLGLDPDLEEYQDHINDLREFGAIVA